jgi:hypothetical protein
MAPDGGAVAWVEESRDAVGTATSSSIFVSPIGDIGRGSCDGLSRQLLVAQRERAVLGSRRGGLRRRHGQAARVRGEPIRHPAGCGASKTRKITRVIAKLGSGCSRKQLRVSGRGVTIIAAKRLTHARCKLTLTVLAGATGRRNLVVTRGKRKTTRRGAVRL